MKIKDFEINEIFDSRGNSTIEVGIASGGLAFYSSLPAGKSRGSREAAVLSFAKAASAGNMKKLGVIRGKDFKTQRSFDEFLIKLDGTKNKRRLGGNVMLGLSMAFARAMAAEERAEVWEFLREEFFGESAASAAWEPVIFSNLINGGEHAKNDLDIQEYMVLAGTKGGVNDAVKKLIGFYRALGERLSSLKRVGNMAIGDEGGYSLDFKNNLEPLEILADLIQKKGLSGSFRLGIDAAANGFFSGGKYQFDGKAVTTEKLAAIYESYFKKIPAFASIEDPFAERDRTGFSLLSKKLKDKIVVGDDLAVTDRELIGKYAGEGIISGVIVKPNQAGTVTEAAEALREARERGIKAIVSHRSGETDDVFIIHLAKAARVYGVKIGAPARERIFKFNELLRIA